MRLVKFVSTDYYHIFNRGVDKRNIFLDKKDLARFLLSMSKFNTAQPIGSIYQDSFRGLSDAVAKSEKLVEFICFCLCPNHYHFIMRPIVDGGIEKFMHKLALGYACYFNKKYNRSGSLFQGPFKAKHIETNQYLLHLSSYVNLNYKIHKIENNLFLSSWDEYFLPEGNKKFCNADIVLKQFESVSDYRKYTEEDIKISETNKELQKFLEYDLQADLATPSLSE